MTQATARVTLGALVRKLGTRPLAQDRLHVAEKRDRLQARIDGFHRQAMEFWGMTTWDVPFRNPEAAGDRDVAESDTDEEEDENYFELSPLEDDSAPERQPLLLPSNLGMRVCQDQGYLNFLKQEKTLRIGQANDALQGIRLGLSRKAMIFRVDIRNARTKTRKLRSWDQISMVDVNVRHHASIYGRARSALVRLGAGPEELARYQMLQKEHLTVTTARIDPSMRGQRDSSLAWFWTIDVKNDIQQADGMAECKLLVPSFLMDD